MTAALVPEAMTSRPWILGVAFCVLASACAKKHPPAPVAGVAAHDASAAPLADSRQQEPLMQGQVHGVNKKLAHPVAVYVDDRQVAVMRPGELPPGLTLVDNKLENNAEKRYFRLAEYLEKIGVDVGAVKTIHLVGHRDHVASIEGNELRAGRDRFVFDFGHKSDVMPKSCWSTTGLKNQLRIDSIRNVTVFVAKQAPALDAKKHCYLSAEGSCATAYDVKGGEASKGTRVYADGKMIGFVKRRLITDASRVAEGSDEYSLGKFLTQLGVDTRRVNGIELMSGDDVIARAAADALSRTDVTFTIPKHSHGRIVARLPAGTMHDGSSERSVPITAIQIYRRAPLGQRALTTMTDEDVAAAARLGAEQTEVGAANGSEDGDEI